MANTTFIGNVRENGDGLRTSIAGSMAATANFHIPNTLSAGNGNVQKSTTDATTVILPKGAVVYQVVIWEAGAAANTTLDLGIAPIGTGVVVADPDGILDAAPIVNRSLTTVNTATAGAMLGGFSTVINAVEFGPAMALSGTGVREQAVVTNTAGTQGAGAISGTLYYFIADLINGAESN